MDGRRKRIKKYAFLNENEGEKGRRKQKRKQNENTCGVENILLRFRCDETSTVLFRFSPSEVVFKANL